MEDLESLVPTESIETTRNIFDQLKQIGFIGTILLPVIWLVEKLSSPKEIKW